MQNQDEESKKYNSKKIQNISGILDINNIKNYFFSNLISVINIYVCIQFLLNNTTNVFIMYSIIVIYYFCDSI